MANICSISVSVDQLIPSCWKCGTRHASYLLKLPQNLAALESACERLGELRNDVKRKVDISEREQLQALDQVLGWLSRVENLESQVSQLIEDGSEEIERKCLGGGCPRQCRTRYKLGNRAARKLEEVNILMTEAPEDIVAERLPSPRIGERPSEATVGMDSRLGKVWSSLNNEHVGVIGLYGLGGVGKTTILTQVNNAFTKRTHDFDFVIWVTVSKNVNLEKIQDDIWKKIGVCDDRWKSKDQDEKANSIWRVLLSEKRFVLLLDDLWGRLNLLELGVPLRSKSNKIVFTTRSEEVCAQMEVDKKIKVECLTRTESWDLFRMKLGEDTLDFHPEIPELAQVVAQECCGLPLVLATMGRAMACKKTPQEWKYAIKVLQSSASTFPEDFNISQQDLIKRWICEGILDEFDDMEGAENQGYDIIGTLIHACLLEETHASYKVKLHDVIRDMALWIACEIEGRGVHDKFLVQVGCGLTEAPEVARWMGPKRISLTNNKIEGLPGSLDCPNLSTLFLQDNSLKMIPDSFFQFMPNLRVLDLSRTSITELPGGISNLVSLQYLNLSYTNIKELPIELKNLSKLKCLLLINTNELSSIPRQLISSLLMLQVIHMLGCGICNGVVLKGGLLSDDNESLVQELESLKYLHDLGVTIASISAFKRLLSSDKLRSHMSSLWLQNFDGSRFLNITSLSNVKHLRNIIITNCGSLEDIKIDWDYGEGKEPIIESHYLNSKVINLHNGFQSLVWVGISRCSRLKDLTWLVFAPNLKSLEINGCDQIQEVICSSKCGEFPKNGEYVSPFARLQQLALVHLPQLKSIYWKALPLICLNTIIVNGCPLLKKLPLNSSSAKENRIVIEGQNMWWEELEWEDVATHNVFLPSFLPINGE